MKVKLKNKYIRNINKYLTNLCVNYSNNPVLIVTKNPSTENDSMCAKSFFLLMSSSRVDQVLVQSHERKISK